MTIKPLQSISAITFASLSAVLLLLNPVQGQEGAATPPPPAARVEKRAEPVSLRHADALAALAVAAGKPVVWIGAAPADTATVTVTDTDLVLDDLARAWADIWRVGLVVTPDAVVFRAPGAFAGITGGHPPVFGTAATAASAPAPPSLVGVRDLLAKAPSTLLARLAALEGAAAEGGVPLAQVEKELPGFGAALRGLLRDVDTTAALRDAPPEQLRIGLDALTQAECFAGRANGKMPLPVSLAGPYPLAGPLAASATPLRESLAAKKAPSQARVLSGTLGSLLRGKMADDPGAPIVDTRLEALPVTVIFPEANGGALWPLLGRTVGIERRVLRGVTFFAPTMHDHDYETRLIASRWAAASQAASPISLFEPYLLAPFDNFPVPSMDLAARAALRGELEHRKRLGVLMPPRFPVSRPLNEADPHDLLEHGSCYFTQTVRLHVQREQPRGGTGKPWIYSIR